MPQNIILTFYFKPLVRHLWGVYMEIIITKNYEEMSKKAAEIIAEGIKANPEITLGLATGSTPIGMYGELVKKYKDGELDFSKVKSYNLDEYYPLKASNDQSYHYFMDKNLFDHINIDKKNTHVPNGEVSDAEAECKVYEKAVSDNGYVDIQVLGIGQNGHIGFNEPDDKLFASTHVTGLTESTIKANSRFFASEDDVPKKAITMGIGTIMKAKKILVLANGKAKHDVISALLDDMITTAIPVTLLKAHPDVTVICDEEAYRG